MANSLLYLKEFRCVTPTEGSGDSPYFIVFTGNRTNPPRFEVKTLRSEDWDGDTGPNDYFKVQTLVGTDCTTSSVVLVAMVEEDDGPDFTGGGGILIQTMLKAWWLKYGGSGWSNLSNEQVASLMADKFGQIVRSGLGNDDYMGVKHLKVTQAVGDLPLLTFNSDGGQYRVRFNMVSTSA
jgi:hypothetical protein